MSPPCLVLFSCCQVISVFLFDGVKIGTPLAKRGRETPFTGYLHTMSLFSLFYF
jgi:hypothetical protein